MGEYDILKIQQQLPAPYQWKSNLLNFCTQMTFISRKLPRFERITKITGNFTRSWGNNYEFHEWTNINAEFPASRDLIQKSNKNVNYYQIT